MSFRYRTLAFLSILISTLTFADESILISKFPGGFGKEWSVLSHYHDSKLGFVPGQRYFGDAGIFRDRNEIAMNHCVLNFLRTLTGQGQLIAFETYLKNRILSPEQVKDLYQSFSHISDNPISFYHLLSEKLPPEPLQNVVHTEEGVDAYLKMAFKPGEGTHPKAIPIQVGGDPLYVHGSLYSVSGQKIHFKETGTGNIEHLSLPWMHDPDFKEAAKYLFNREKYPLVWELGRASNDGVMDFNHLMNSASADIQRQLMHTGLPGEELESQAYVSLYVNNQENFERMEKSFKKSVFLRSEKDPHKAVFMIPLKEFTQKFPGSNTYAGLKNLKNASQNLSEITLAKLEAQSELTGLQVLDFTYKQKRQSSPLILNSNPGRTNLVPIDPFMEHHQVDPKKMPTGEKFQIREAAFPQIKDPGFLTSITHMNRDPWIQISNLDPQLAEKNPEYVASSIVASFDHFLRPYVVKEQGGTMTLAEAGENMKKNKLRFLVTTQYPETAKAIEFLQPSQSIPFDLSNDLNANTHWAEIERQSGGKVKRPSKILKGYFFTPDEVAKMRAWIYLGNGKDPLKIPQAQIGYFRWLQGMSGF